MYPACKGNGVVWSLLDLFLDMQPLESHERTIIARQLPLRPAALGSQVSKASNQPPLSAQTVKVKTINNKSPTAVNDLSPAVTPTAVSVKSVSNL